MPGPAAAILAPLLRQSETCVDRCLSNWKIGFAAILFVEGLIFGHVVYLIKRVTSSSSNTFSRVFHLGNALSGGVFFAAGVLHILPEAIALMSGEHAHGEEAEHDDERNERWNVLRQGEDDDHDDDHGDEEEESVQFPWAYFILMLSFYMLFFVEKLLLPKVLASRAAKLKPSGSDEEIGALHENEGEKEQVTEEFQSEGFRSPEFVTGLIEIVGISAHSLFESMALGLSGSFSTVLNIFIATVAHRWATASAIGFKLLRTLNYLSFLVLLVLFSAFVPIGVGIGAALGNLSETVQGVLFSISAGTFIYIGVYEVLSEEFVEDKQWPFTKFIMTLIGAGAITVVTVILNVLDIHG